MIECTACRHENLNGSGFCESCGAALADPRQAARAADEVEAEFMLDQAKKGRVALLVVGGLQTLAGVFEAVMADAGLELFVFAVNLGLAGVFFGLAWWCRWQPFAAAIVGLFLFAGLHLLNAIVDPSVILNGIIVKVIVITMLVRAVKAGLAHREFVRSRGMA